MELRRRRLVAGRHRCSRNSRHNLGTRSQNFFASTRSFSYEGAWTHQRAAPQVKTT